VHERGEKEEGGQIQHGTKRKDTVKKAYPRVKGKNNCHEKDKTQKSMNRKFETAKRIEEKKNVMSQEGRAKEGIQAHRSSMSAHRGPGCTRPNGVQRRYDSLKIKVALKGSQIEISPKCARKR